MCGEDRPADAELTLAQAVEWVYRGPIINRLPIDGLRRQLDELMTIGFSILLVKPA